MDWGSLKFGYVRTPYNVRCTYKDGKWGAIEVSTEETINMHMAATCLHYGQEAFEGLKAFRGADGRIRIFRADENAKRMINSAKAVLMAEPSVDLFVDMVKKVVELNKEFVPPYGTGASLYIRPLLIGTGAQVGVKPAAEYMLLMFVTPVGPYFSGDLKAVVMRDYDRAAPHGTGHVKVGGNYAASLVSQELGHEKGYDAVIYMDPATKQYIDECGAANFFIIKGNRYITPQSSSILPSITNKSLCTLAEDMGLQVERRHIALDELNDVDEVAACGTAAVISPVGRIDDPEKGKNYVFDVPADGWCRKLYNRLVDIQYGRAEDKFGWVTIIEG